MSDKAYYLSEDDVQTLREMAHDYRTRPRNSRNVPVTFPVSKAPEVYVAKVAMGGIPARSDDTPGSADCDIYFIDVDSGNTLTLLDTDQQTVWNLSTTAIPESAAYIGIKRDKAGQWLADAPGSSSSVVRFQLAAFLFVGDEASATTMVLSSGTYTTSGGTSITVVDNDQLWSAPSGFRGWAQARSDGKYDILFMEMQDELVEFTATADRDPSLTYFLANPTGSTYLQGGRHGLSGTDLHVIDPLHLFNRVITGCKGLALFDYNSQTYRAVMFQQQCTKARALVNQSGGLNTTGAVDIDNFVGISASPSNFVPATLPTTAYNIFNHYGADDDAILLDWDEYTGQWIITDVIKKTHNILSDMRQNAGNTWFEAEQTQVAVEYIDAPSYSNKIAIGACP